VGAEAARRCEPKGTPRRSNTGAAAYSMARADASRGVNAGMQTADSCSDLLVLLVSN
jgi:hypothetical protein